MSSSHHHPPPPLSRIEIISDDAKRRKKKRSVEWQETRQRWKRRKYDWRAEADVGLVFGRQARSKNSMDETETHDDDFWKRGVAPSKAAKRAKKTHQKLSALPSSSSSLSLRNHQDEDDCYTRKTWSRVENPRNHLVPLFPLSNTCRPSTRRRGCVRALARHMFGDGAAPPHSFLARLLLRQETTKAAQGSFVDGLEEWARQKGQQALSHLPRPTDASKRTIDDPLRLVTPETTYKHQPGTVPPVPTGTSRDVCLYGPSDRYENVLHTGRIDPDLYTLSRAGIVQLIMAAAGEEDDDASVKQQHLVQQQLSTLLEALLQHNQSQLYKRLRRQFRQPDLQLPLAGYYRAVREYGSLVTAGLLQIPSCNDPSHSVVEPEEAEEKEQSLSLLVSMVHHLWDFLEEHIHHNGLQMFADLHIWHGVLRIGKMLPESAMAILAQPLDRCYPGGRTPICLFRRVLEHLEELQCLSETQSFREEGFVIHVGELEYAFFRAAKTFAQCVEQENTHVEYHSWYLAALASSLLLCSGQAMGGSGNGRRALPKFPELRRDTARAFSELVRVTQAQPSQQAHQTLVSFLEWSQVLGLLFGPRGRTQEDEKEIYQGVCALHRYHAKQWMYHENSMASAGSSDHALGNNDELEIRARALEMNPSDIENWRALVTALGPLGVLDDRSSSCSVHNSACPECSRLIPGRCWDHETRSAGHNDKWWGVGRCDWWQTCLLAVNRPMTDRSFVGTKQIISNGDEPSTSVDEFYRKMFEHLKNVDPSRCNLLSQSSTRQSDQESSFIAESNNLQWLDEYFLSLNNETDRNADRCLNTESKDYEVLSPTLVRECVHPILSTGRQGSMIDGLNDLWELHLLLYGNDARHYEMMGYKILILCHLYSVAFESIGVLVQELFCSALVAWIKHQSDSRHDSLPTIDVYLSWNPESPSLDDDTRSAWQTLRWLYGMGLDVSQVWYARQPNCPC